MSASCLGLYMVIEFSCSVAAFSVLLGQNSCLYMKTLLDCLQNSSSVAQVDQSMNAWYSTLRWVNYHVCVAKKQQNELAGSLCPTVHVLTQEMSWKPTCTFIMRSTDGPLSLLSLCLITSSEWNNYQWSSQCSRAFFVSYSKRRLLDLSISPSRPGSSILSFKVP